jgi:O-antigen ligase
MREKREIFAKLPFTRLMFLWAILSFASAFTAIITMGPEFMLERLDSLKRWADQFIVFFAFANLIRDGAMARRVCLYLMVGELVVLGFGFDEWLEKREYGSIEKSRLLGPQLQPNDLGAFLVYGAALPAAWLLTNIGRPLVWIATLPSFYMMARVLLGTYSRGGLIALGLMAVALLMVRGRLLLIFVAASAIVFVEFAPELLPQSLTARMSQTTDEQGELDKSSQTRLILWQAAADIIKENPLLGGGFETFHRLKDRYTEVSVQEADNHNMFLFIASQMGIPALIVFLLIFIKLFIEGARLSGVQDRFARTIALGGGCALSAAMFAVNMFGSRMVDICVTGYVWITIAAFAHVVREYSAAPRPSTDRL